MRRQIVVIATFLVMGAIVNIAVAWGCALWISPARAAYQFGDSRESGTIWTVARFDAPGTTMLFSWRGQDHGQPYPIANLVPPELSAPRWSGLAKPLPTFAADPMVMNEHRIVDGRGWPFRSLSLHAGSLQRGDDTDGKVFKHWLIDLDPSMSSPIDWEGWTTFRMLPLRPIGWGFLANTLLYAIALWLLVGGPFMLRRAIRRGRGQCEKCAYPIGVSPVCSECGSPVARGDG